MRDLVEVSEVPVEDCLRGTPVTAADLEDPGAEVQTRDELRVLANVRAARPGYTELGLDAGSRCTSRDFGMIGLLMQCGETFGATLTRSILFQDLCHPLPLSTQQREDTTLVLTLDPSQFDAALQPYLIDQQLAAVSAIWTELVGRPLRARALELTQPPAPHADRYGEMYHVRPRFRAPANRIVFDTHPFDEPLPLAAHAEVIERLENECRAILRGRHTHVGTAGLVRGQLERASDRVPTLDAVAEALNMAPRTLRRALRAEGTSFRELEAETRLGSAVHLLETTSLPLTVISARLGYSNMPAFCFAFKRWTGQSPGAFRSGHEGRNS